MFPPLRWIALVVTALGRAGHLTWRVVWWLPDRLEARRALNEAYRAGSGAGVERDAGTGRRPAVARSPVTGSRKPPRTRPVPGATI